MVTSDNQAFSNEVDDVKNLWTAMAGIKSKFEQGIEEVSQDLQQSFQHSTNQIQA